MTYVLYLHNRETGKKVVLQKKFQDKRMLDRYKRATQKSLQRKGAYHITVHEKKLR